MKKQIIKTFMFTMLIVSCMVIMAACDGHGHSWSGDWFKDDNFHWHACTDEDCGEKKDNAAHVFGGAYKTSAAQHWQECACGQESTRVNHTKSNWIIDNEATAAKDGSRRKECTECKYILETEVIEKHIHDFGDDCICDIEGCGYEKPHTYSEYSCLCSVCGYEKNHTLGTDYQSSSLQHWKECLNCGGAVNSAAHNFMGGFCSVCGYGENTLFGSMPELIAALSASNANFRVNVTEKIFSLEETYNYFYETDGTLSKYGDLDYGNFDYYDFDNGDYYGYNDGWRWEALWLEESNIFIADYGWVFYDFIDNASEVVKNGNVYTLILEWHESDEYYSWLCRYTYTIKINSDNIVITVEEKEWTCSSGRPATDQDLLDWHEYVEMTITFGGITVEIPEEALLTNPLGVIKPAVEDFLSPYGLSIPMPQNIFAIENVDVNEEYIFFHVYPSGGDLTLCRNYIWELRDNYGFTYYTGSGSYTARPNTYQIFASTNNPDKIVTILFYSYSGGSHDYHFDVKIEIQNASILDIPFTLPEGDFVITYSNGNLEYTVTKSGNNLRIYKEASSISKSEYIYTYDEQTEKWSLARRSYNYISGSYQWGEWYTEEMYWHIAEYNSVSLLYYMLHGNNVNATFGSIAYASTYALIDIADYCGSAVVNGRYVKVYKIDSITEFSYDYSYTLYVDVETGLVIKGDRERLDNHSTAGSWDAIIEMGEFKTLYCLPENVKIEYTVQTGTNPAASAILTKIGTDYHWSSEMIPGLIFERCIIYNHNLETWSEYTRSISNGSPTAWVITDKVNLDAIGLDELLNSSAWVGLSKLFDISVINGLNFAGSDVMLDCRIERYESAPGTDIVALHPAYGIVLAYEWDGSPTTRGSIEVTFWDETVKDFGAVQLP